MKAEVAKGANLQIYRETSYVQKEIILKKISQRIGIIQYTMLLLFDFYCYLDGRQQQQQKAHMEELAAEGRKAAADHKAAEIRPGWSRALPEAKVRSTASKDSEVLGALHEGSRVLVAEVCGKKARIQQPLSGWIALSKHTEPVLEQESCQVQEGELASSWVVSHVLARLSQPAPQAEQPLEAPEENVDHDADVDSEVEPPAPPMTTAEASGSASQPARSWWATLRQALKSAFRCAGWCRG